MSARRSSPTRCVTARIPFFAFYHIDTPPEAKKLGYNASSFAFTNNVPVFMQLADVVVCKPGAQPQSNTAVIA